jgi:hypothetical protein
MQNETSKTRSLKVAFLLDPTSLNNLQTLLLEIQGDIEYKVKFSDGTIVKYDVEEVIGQPNAGRKSIIGVSVSIAGQPGRSMFLRMRGDPEPSVEYTLTGMQQEVIYFSDKLDDWIASCTRLYSPFYSSNLGALIVIGVIALPLTVMNRVAKIFPRNGSDWHSYLPMAALAGVAVAEYGILKLFPRATFAIGHGATREKFFDAVRVSVVLALAIGCLSELLMRYL